METHRATGPHLLLERVRRDTERAFARRREWRCDTGADHVAPGAEWKAAALLSVGLERGPSLTRELLILP